MNAKGKRSKMPSMTIQTLYRDTCSALTGHPEGIATLFLTLLGASMLSASTSTALYEVLSCLLCFRKGLGSCMMVFDFNRSRPVAAIARQK